MNAFREIVVNEETFLWRYVFDAEDHQCNSFLVFRKADKNGKLIIYFQSKVSEYGYCPFNEGLSAQYDDESVIINLNQPRFIAEILAFVLNELKLDFEGKTLEYYEGIELMHLLGYKFTYHKNDKSQNFVV